MYYLEERESNTMNELYSDLRHVTIAIAHLGDGAYLWFVNMYNLALFYCCFAQLSR